MKVIVLIGSLLGGLLLFITLLGAIAGPVPGGAAGVPALAVTRRPRRPALPLVARSRRPRRRHARTPVASVDPQAYPPTLHLVKWGKATTDAIGIHHVRGTAINNTGHDLSYAQATFRLLDREGAQVGTAVANTADLPAGARWTFDAIGTGEGALHISPPAMTGY